MHVIFQLSRQRIDLFRFYVLFSHWRSHFINDDYICTGIRRNLNETVLQSIIT